MFNVFGSCFAVPFVNGTAFVLFSILLQLHTQTVLCVGKKIFSKN